VQITPGGTDSLPQTWMVSDCIPQPGRIRTSTKSQHKAAVRHARATRASPSAPWKGNQSQTGLVRAGKLISRMDVLASSTRAFNPSPGVRFAESHGWRVSSMRGCGERGGDHAAAPLFWPAARAIRDEGSRRSRGRHWDIGEPPIHGPARARCGGQSRGRFSWCEAWEKDAGQVLRSDADAVVANQGAHEAAGPRSVRTVSCRVAPERPRARLSHCDS